MPSPYKVYSNQTIPEKGKKILFRIKDKDSEIYVGSLQDNGNIKVEEKEFSISDIVSWSYVNDILRHKQEIVKENTSTGTKYYRIFDKGANEWYSDYLTPTEFMEKFPDIYYMDSMDLEMNGFAISEYDKDFNLL